MGSPKKKTVPTVPTQPSLPEYDKRRCLNLSSEDELSRNIVEYIADCTLALGFEEDVFFSNLHIATTGAACLLGLYGTVVLKFPEDAFKLKICVALFFALLGVLFFMEALYLRTAIISIFTPTGAKLRIFGWVERKDNKYTICTQTNGQLKRHSYDLGEFFDIDGYLVTSTVFRYLIEMLKEAGVDVNTTKKSK